MERLIVISRVIKDATFNLKEALRGLNRDIGVIMELQPLENDSTRTKVIFYNGEVQKHAGDESPIYEWMVVPTKNIEDQHIHVGDLVRTQFFPERLKRLGSLDEIKQVYPRK